MHGNVNIHTRHDRVHIVVYLDNITFLFSFLSLLNERIVRKNQQKL